MTLQTIFGSIASQDQGNLCWKFTDAMTNGEGLSHITFAGETYSFIWSTIQIEILPICWNWKRYIWTWSSWQCWSIAHIQLKVILIMWTCGTFILSWCYIKCWNASSIGSHQFYQLHILEDYMVYGQALDIKHMCLYFTELNERSAQQRFWWNWTVPWKWIIHITCLLLQKGLIMIFLCSIGCLQRMKPTVMSSVPSGI